MHIELINQPGNTVGKVSMVPGDQLTAEGGSMIAMSPNISITTSTYKKQAGSLLKAAKRVISGESFFLNHFECHDREGVLWLGTTLSGDITTLDVDGQNLVVQGGSYLASTPGVDVDMGWQGFKSLFSGEGLFWLHLKGRGTAMISSFGAIYPVHVDGEYIVDTGHIVAFSDTLNFKISKAGSSWLHSFLGGEGLVCRFSGHGTVWCQSHNPRSFGAVVGARLRARRA